MLTAIVNSLILPADRLRDLFFISEHYLRSKRMKNLHQWRQKSLILEELQAKSNSKSVVRQNREALGDIGNLVNVPTRKDTARKAEVVVIINPEENEKSCKPHVSKRGGFTVSLYY